MNVRKIKFGAYGGFAVSVVFAAMMAMIGMLPMASKMVAHPSALAAAVQGSARDVGTTSPTSASQTFTLPAGTRLLVRMIDSVDSKKNKVGERFRASLEAPLTVDGRVVAPKGTDVYGRLSEAKGAGRISGKAELQLELTDIVIGQETYPIMTGDYGVKGKGAGTGTAKKVGVGTGLGALIGAIAGGGKGALKGAGVGAAAGTGVALITKGEQVKVPSETVLEFRIEQPLTVRKEG